MPQTKYKPLLHIASWTKFFFTFFLLEAKACICNWASHKIRCIAFQKGKTEIISMRVSYVVGDFEKIVKVGSLILLSGQTHCAFIELCGLEEPILVFMLREEGGIWKLLKYEHTSSVRRQQSTKIGLGEKDKRKLDNKNTFSDLECFIFKACFELSPIPYTARHCIKYILFFQIN